MTRMGYYTDPARKELQVYQDFSGGLNVTTSHDNMADNELSYIKNMSFDERGAIARRTGMVNHFSFLEPKEKAQMYFRHYKDHVNYDELIAADGRLYVNGKDAGIKFQKERFIEAVQWYQKSYIATGSGLYEYDGLTGVVKKVEPYAPEPLEALYIGTNGLAKNPDKFLSDGTGSTIQIAGVVFSERYGVMNEPFTITAYHIKPAEVELEYKFEYRYPFEADGVYHIGQDWSSSKEWTFVAEGEGDMQFRISARKKGKKTSDAQYLVPKYTIKPAKDPNDIQPELSGIHSCNRILKHWERLILYGDTKNVNTIYISHLKRADYFPVPNTLHFETTRTEPLNIIVRYRDHLLAFTDSSIQALFGKSPSDYQRRVLNSAIGCIAPRGATVMDNYVAFLSADGIYYLKNVGYVEDKANVTKLDDKIATLVPKNARDAVATVFDDQLQFTFPSQKIRLRFYKAMGIWTYDESESLDLVEMVVYDNELYGQRTNGNIVRFSNDVYNDLGEIYEAVFETRYLDFGVPYHPKKLKELQILAKSFVDGQVANVKVYIDGVRRVYEPLEWEAEFVTPEEYNTFIDKLKVSGKALRVKIRVEHTLDEYIQFLGFGIIHKLKKP